MADKSSRGSTAAVPKERAGPVERLMSLTATAVLSRSTDGRSHARVTAGERRETYALASAAFRDWLIDGYFRTYHEVPSEWSIRRTRGALEALARFEGGTPSIFVRVGHGNDGDSSTCYLDIADSRGQAVRIGPQGWSVVDDCGVHFRRPDGLSPLPIPSRDGSIEPLRRYVNLSDRDFRLLVVWMAAALRPVGPYPILALYGQNGSTKSTLAEVVRRLIDPQATKLLGQPRSMRELMVTAVNGWLLAYDNLSVIPQWLSDGLCMLATGGAMAGNASFSSSERTVFHAQRPVVLCGIDEFIRRADLTDRAVFLSLPPIFPSRRRRETEFWASFQQDSPRILGGLLDAVAGGMRELPSVQPAQLPRMADFAAFAEAVGRTLGWPAETALSDYDQNRRDATMSHLDDSPLATMLLDLSPDFFIDWSGPASELLDELTPLARSHAESPLWPKTSELLSRELRRIAPQLAIHGIFVHFSRNHHGRLLSVSRDPIVTRNGDIPNPQPSENGDTAGIH